MVRGRVVLSAEAAAGPPAASVEPGAPGGVTVDAGVEVPAEEADVVLLWSLVSLVLVLPFFVSPEGELQETL